MMQRALHVTAAAAVAWLAVLAVALPQAGAAIDYVPCPRTNQYACAHLVVPLDPGGAVPGTISLSLRRHRAAIGEAHTAIVALAGGPGQPAIPFAEQFAELLGPIADTRDLIVYDQRGTGSSGPLHCKTPRRHLTMRQQIAACAAAIGPARAFYTSADTVADIEAIRQAGGYEKLVLYGTSYGTKVAEDYSQAHPDRLDSVVATNGPDVLDRPTFSALPRVLRGLCARGACRGVTPNPVEDLTRLLRRIHRHGLVAGVLGGHGRAKKVPITAQLLLQMLLAGDLSPRLRAEFVTDVRAAAQGEAKLLARTLSALESSGEGEEIDLPLYLSTTCEEQSFPFNRAASPAQRLHEAAATALALPQATFAPFSAADAVELSDIPACSAWPYPMTPPPAADTAPLPSVPTLILSGADDLRTPTSVAQELAREIPSSHLLVVPFTGHSVLGSDPSGCSSEALQALFKGAPIKPCHEGRLPAKLRPQAPPPQSVAALSPIHGYGGLAGRTAHGIALTATDLGRQLLLQGLASGLAALFGGNGSAVGGLHSGWAQESGNKVSFHDYSLIPGLTLSGTVGTEVVKLRIGGSGAAHGTLRRGPHHTLVGTLGGLPVRLPATSVISVAIVGIDAATRADHHPRRPLGAGVGLPGTGLRIGRARLRRVP
jgi:pimeloyl-ACP methyl ester carboxylesterase